ncbi:iron-sulfur cluster repair protein YtfE [Rhodoblastus sp.]|uniref:iron-sulfur cluster repair protein YtfE n=1 Tax=Rhodoblastus sp. TaxID=1962975 RepID=UPI003F985F97
MTHPDQPALPLAETPVGEIAARLPGSTAVFRSFKLDYCCGGRQTLASAVEKRGLSLAEIERSLVALDQQPVTAPDEPDDIIEFILSRFHETHRRELPELIRLARRVEQVHAGHPDVPLGLTEFLNAMAAELGSHMRKEEAMLFPMIRAGHPMVSAPIAVMEAEHEDHFAALKQLEAMTANMEPPDDACASWRALYGGLRKFADDLSEHIHTENNILFPRFSHR